MQKRTLNAKFDSARQNSRKSREIIEDFSKEKQPSQGTQSPPPQKSNPCDKKSPPQKPLDKSIYQTEKSPFEIMNTK